MFYLNGIGRRPSPCTPTLLGTEGVLRCCMYCVVDFCLYASVLDVERCADLVSVFFGTYGGTLCRSAIWPLYSSIFMVVRWADPVSVFFDTYRNILYQSDIFRTGRPVRFRHLFWFFLSAGSVSQRKVASGRAAAEEG